MEIAGEINFFSRNLWNMDLREYFFLLVGRFRHT